MFLDLLALACMIKFSLLFHERKREHRSSHPAWGAQLPRERLKAFCDTYRGEVYGDVYGCMVMYRGVW